MCGRFTLRSPAESIASLFEGLEVPEWIPRFNIAPTQGAPAVRYREGKPIFTPLRWGLVPSWAKELAVGNRMINARSETVDSKPAFRDAFQKRRCLIVADGFFEWKNVGKRKFPFYITRVDGRPFCMAGLWETWGPAGAEIETCTILTTVANACLE
ncbi:MAG: SOS response-associated peptidase, partial [Planctomycetota bacterium]|nr:SOS response-associated peptidase [Planctomycetota bacterium]